MTSVVVLFVGAVTAWGQSETPAAHRATGCAGAKQQDPFARDCRHSRPSACGG